MSLFQKPVGAEVTRLKLLRLAQLGDGARRLRRFDDPMAEARKTHSPLAFFTLKRRERRAPRAPEKCHSIGRASIEEN
jgi:hypothetical protein